MKISILTPNFSGNCFGRAWLLAKLLQGHYDIEVVGPAFGHGIWKPLKNLCDFKIKIVKGFANGQFEFKKLLSMISGDVIYASKPLMASFGVGLTKKFSAGKPLVLDIDDWELGFGKEFYDSLSFLKRINDFRVSITNLRSYYYTIILDKLIWLANSVTVSGGTLQSMYGGKIIHHGRDDSTFNPKKVDKKRARNKYLGPKHNNSFIFGFIGTPGVHKGIEDLLYAVKILSNENVILMMVGKDQGGYFKKVEKMIEEARLANRVIFLPEQPFDKLSEFLSIMDLVVIPQKKRPASHGQVPAKIFDAMAMAKPIISTNVSDIPEILRDCGWIVESEKPKELAEMIKYVFDHPEEAEQMGLKAREELERKYSWDIIGNELVSVFETVRLSRNRGSLG